MAECGARPQSAPILCLPPLMSENDEATATLYRAPLSDFVAERKRLADELKAAGDKQGAVRLGKLARPPVSAWVVNQLWWREREAFERLLAAAARVKAGDRDASQAHRQALARLRDLAAQMLKDSGNAASETTQRRVVATLSALAANGGFAPDAPGMLSADRDPPGFEALGFGAPAAPPEAATPRVARPSHGEHRPRDEAAEDRREEAERRRTEEAERRRTEEAERRRAEEAERQRRLAERERLSERLREVTGRRDAKRRELLRLRAELDSAEQSLKEDQALLSELEQQLASL